MSAFDSIPLLPDDPILSLPIQMAADLRSHKVNLGIGAYRTSEGQPFILSTVTKAEHQILTAQKNKEYLPIEGDKNYLKSSLELILGAELANQRATFIAQTVGGSGALRLSGEFLAETLPQSTLYVSEQTWPNHPLIFKRAGLNVKTYPYLNSYHHQLDFEKISEAILKMTPKSIILLQASCHNPTGVDPSLEQWKALCQLIKQQQLIVFFDFAYQGFGEGLDKDAEAIRYFVSQGIEVLVASSFSKNFGLYGERVGTFLYVSENFEIIPRLSSHFKQLIRGNYSTPPLHGALIVATILQDPFLKKEWESELSAMRKRIVEMRQALAEGLLTKRQYDFNFINHQKGIFSYMGLKENQVRKLRTDYGLYMPLDGRINVAGLTPHNLQYVIDAIASVL